MKLIHRAYEGEIITDALVVWKYNSILEYLFIALNIFHWTFIFRHWKKVNQFRIYNHNDA